MTVKPTYEELEKRIQELEKAEADCNFAEDRLKKIFDNTQDAIFIHDLEGKILDVNDKMCRIYGLTKEEALEVSIEDVSSSRMSMKVLLERWQEVLNGKKLLFDWEARRPKDESVFNVEVSIQMVSVHDEDIILANVRDITERKQAEEVLRETKQRFERMLGAVPDMISIHDPQMNILYSNWQGYGAVPEEKRLLGTKCYNTYRGFDDPCPDCLAKNVLITGLPVQSEVQLPDGKWVDLRVIPLKDKQGKVEMFMEWVRDITDTKNIEMELKSQKDLLEGVFDAIKDVIGIQLPDQTVVRYNRAGYDLLGLTEADVQGKKCYELIGRTSPCEICPTSKAVATKKMETLAKYVPELEKHFICTSNPVLDESGGINLVIEQLTDITEKKRIDEKLQQTQKMESIGSLAGGIAHDFNNILFPILGISEMIIDDFDPGSPERESLKEIMNAGKRGKDLVRQILAIGRQSEQQPIPVQIQPVLKEVLKLIRSTIPANVHIKQDIQKDCGAVEADPTQLHQIAMNLITNASHALEDDVGEIAVRLKEVDLETEDFISQNMESGRYAVLTVSDTGSGIADDMMGKIFDPYFTTKKNGKGTGLGLSVVHGIVKSYGGDIKVYSEAGKGTSFHVYLPVINKTAEFEKSEKNRPLPTGNERILVVDDEAPIIQLEEALLKKLGYEVSSSTGSIDALEKFKMDPYAFDLVLTDMSMPNMTGEKLARAMIAIRPDLPVIICTGFSERIDEQKAEAIGVKAFLMKPILNRDIAQTVRKVLDEN
ncbi:MAG: PAS domain S-box protein [Desulfobacteraceae bacterium]